MKLINVIYLLVFFKSSLSFAQVKADNFIKKEEIKSSFTVEGNPTDNQVRSILNNKSDQSKVYVFFENKFHTIDTLKKIKNVNDYNMEIIKFPDSISKDIKSLLVLKKKAN
ncbi:MAG: hypothetical protein ACOYLT_07245 [Flavobacterium sp.]|uniref:hypothetical protein n=1 Tax=Flavobacterium sp. TaxID=239 RepID=UPI003BCCA9B5